MFGLLGHFIFHVLVFAGLVLYHKAIVVLFQWRTGTTATLVNDVMWRHGQELKKA